MSCTQLRQIETRRRFLCLLAFKRKGAKTPRRGGRDLTVSGRGRSVGAGVCRRLHRRTRAAPWTRRLRPGSNSGTLGGASLSSDLSPPAPMNTSRFLIVGSFVLIAGCASGPPRQDLSEVKQKASAGDPVAQRQLGIAHDSAGSRNPNYQEAARWYQLAANQGDAIAQNNLGSLYEQGVGVPKDFSKAFELYRQSAEKGFAM